jgi:hypothetical protein
MVVIPAPVMTDRAVVDPPRATVDVMAVAVVSTEVV